MELEAVIQRDMAEGTVMIERKPVPQKSSLLLACEHTRGYSKSTGANKADESLCR